METMESESFENINVEIMPKKGAKYNLKLGAEKGSYMIVLETPWLLSYIVSRFVDESEARREFERCGKALKSGASVKVLDMFNARIGD